MTNAILQSSKTNRSDKNIWAATAIPSNNNIGFLRLLFATFVIIGHAPEIIDGNRTREPLTLIFHTLSLGEVSVDAFFLLSGFLITASIVNSVTLRDYFIRRIIRIYPAFIVAFLLTVLGLGSFLGVRPQPLEEILVRLIFLLMPGPSPELYSLHYKSLNGSMWTITYEFHCYIYLAIIYAIGLLKCRRFMLLLASILLLAMFFSKFSLAQDYFAHAKSPSPLFIVFVGHPTQIIRFMGIFFCGSVAFLYKNTINNHLNLKHIIIYSSLLILCLFNHHTAEIGLIIFGGLLLYWLAFKAQLGKLGAINNSWDISYGTYLYGWPIETMIAWFHHGISPFLLAFLSVPSAYFVATMSWFYIEKPMKMLLSSRKIHTAETAKNSL